MMIDDDQICAECGHSVAWGSGRLVNRVPILDDYSTRLEYGWPVPQGGWICAECDLKTRQ